MEKIVEREKATAMAVNYLSRYQKTKKELLTYLEKKQVDKKLAREVADKCQEYGYINDLSYAKMYTDIKKRANSRRKIVFELKNKGISEELIENLEFNDGEAVDTIVKKHFDKNKSDEKNTKKLVATLARKGFSYDDIKRAVSKYENMEDECE